MVLISVQFGNKSYSVLYKLGYKDGIAVKTVGKYLSTFFNQILHKCQSIGVVGRYHLGY